MFPLYLVGWWWWDPGKGSHVAQTDLTLFCKVKADLEFLNSLKSVSLVTEFSFNFLRQGLYVSIASHYVDQADLEHGDILLLTVAFMYFDCIHSSLPASIPPPISAEPFFPTSPFPAFVFVTHVV